MPDIFQTITGGFFDSVNQDRLYNADQMNMPYKKIVSDGLFFEGGDGGNVFKVTAGGGMTVNVGPGNALIGGKWAENEDALAVEISGNTSESARVDSVILRLDANIETRAVGIVYRQGAAAAPALDTSDGIKEFRLANITVPVNAVAITDVNIADTRGTADCPWASSIVTPSEAQLTAGVGAYIQQNPTALIPAIESSVSEWLDDHPEATTTLQDGAVTRPKLSANLKKTVDSVNGGGMRLNPTYIGEWVLPYQYVPSTFVKIGNMLYLLNFNRNGANGKLITVNLSNNTVVSTSDKYLNHCNSAAYVEERNSIYIAPSQKSAADGTISAAYGIIKYTADWSDYTEIGTDKVFLAVSMDEVTGKVYAYRINGELYEINVDDSLTLIGTISVPNISAFNQDIAVHNGFIYLSGYNHYFLYTSIETLDAAVYGTLSRNDNFGKYIFDENESWEFYDGVLYCVEYSKHREVQSFGFFVSMSYRQGQSLPVDETNLAGSQFTANIFSSDANKFTLSETRFLHPNQLNTCLKEFETINIDNDTNFGDVYIASNLVINNNLVCDTLQMRGDTITFDPPSVNKVVTIGVINIQSRGGRIVFGGPSGMTYNITSIIFGYSLAHVSIKAGITITPYQFGGLRLITPLAQPVMTFADQSALSKALVVSKTSQNITVPAGGSIAKTYTDTVPYDTNWRVMFEYGEGGIIGTVGRTISGSEIRIFVYLYNYTNADIVVDNFRLVIIPGQTV